MKELNKKLLVDLQGAGFRYLIYHSVESFALIVPVNDEVENGFESYTISIYDGSAYEMAGGVINFSFYVLHKSITENLKSYRRTTRRRSIP